MAEIKTLKELKSDNQKTVKPVKDFINSLLDDKSFVEMDAYISGNTEDGGFNGEGVVCGAGKISEESVMIFCQNAEVMKGALGRLHTKKIKKCIQTAAQNNLPLISVIDSYGVRLNEGMDAVNGFAAVMREAHELGAAHIAVIRGGSLGLMSYYTRYADVVIMLDKSVMATTSPLIINAKSGADAKDDNFSGTAGAAYGLSDITVKSEAELKPLIKNLLNLLNDNTEFKDEPNRISKLNKNQDVKSILNEITDKNSFIEFLPKYAPEIITGLAALDGMTVGIVANNPKINGGKITVNTAKKINRILDICYNFDFPVINFVNSQGITADIKEERNGLINSVYSVIANYLDLNNKISIITGSAVGAAYAAFAAKGLGYNYILGWEGADISVLDGIQSAELFFADEIAKAKNKDKIRTELAGQYTEEFSGIIKAAQEGLIDNVIEPQDTRPYLIALLQSMR